MQAHSALPGNRKLSVLLGCLLSMLLLTSCATTAPPETGRLADAKQQGYSTKPQDSSLPAKRTMVCRPGFYFCPGKVEGCCPQGWGCASTHCINPAARKRTVVSCRVGHYFCPGLVEGCCPNGWGCASTHCIRPKGQSL